MARRAEWGFGDSGGLGVPGRGTGKSERGVLLSLKSLKITSVLTRVDHTWSTIGDFEHVVLDYQNELY
jgi:hypothetical protein